MFFSASLSLADVESKLNGHWAENLVDKEFMTKHFQYLGSQGYIEFLPDQAIIRGDFIKSLYSLLKDNGTIIVDDENNEPVDLVDALRNKGIITDDEFNVDGELLRKEAVDLIINAIALINKDFEATEAENPFTDLDELDGNQIASILEASRLGIITGYTDNTFRPNGTVSQIQAIILLQRLKGELYMKKGIGIPFKVIENKKVYSGEGTIETLDKEDKIIVTISKQFPNPGYGIEIANIIQDERGKYQIITRKISPDPNKMYPQVITYQVIKLEVDKQYLEEGAHSFYLVPQPGLPIE